MRHTTSSFLKAAAIRRSLKKNAPDRFPIRESNDFYSTRITHNVDQTIILVNAIDDTQIMGWQWENDAFRKETTLPVDTLNDSGIEIVRFYGYSKFTYKNVLHYWVYELACVPFFLHLGSRLAQSYYNSRARFRHDRLEILQNLIKLHFDRVSDESNSFLAPKKFYATTAFASIYGARAFGYPNHELELARFNLILGSLAATGDLIEENNAYKISPKAIVTLAEFEKEERRHRDSVTQSKRLFWITVATALAAAIQAYSAFIK